MCYLGRDELIADAENFGNDYAVKNNKENDVTSFVNCLLKDLHVCVKMICLVSFLFNLIET